MNDFSNLSISQYIATIFGLGNKTKFPGTLGSIVALIFSFLSFYFLGKPIYIIIFLASLLVSFYAIREIHKQSELKDYSFIIVDEWIGMWFVNFFLFEIHLTLSHTILVAILGFIIFRLIDIFKFLPPIGTIDKAERQTALSIIMDDVIAGVYTYAILMSVFGFYNWNYILFAFLILLTPMVANMTPVLLKAIKRFDQPIEEKIFGRNKTWRGLFGGTLVGTLFFYLIFNFCFSTMVLDINSIILVGFLFSFGALSGDLIKSYFKRKMDIKDGESWVPFDQVDYIFGAVVATCFVYYYSLGQLVLMLIIGGALSHISHRFAYRIKMIDTKS